MQGNDATDSTRPVNNENPGKPSKFTVRAGDGRNLPADPSDMRRRNPDRPKPLPPGEFWPRNDIIEWMKTSEATFDLWVHYGLFCTYFGTPYLWAFTDDVMAIARAWTADREAEARKLRHTPRKEWKSTPKPESKPRRKKGT